jgi:FlaA1/EpsC-like NDP-sugar epimerase
MKGNRKLKLSVVRYGNVFASRGSVVPLFLENKSNVYNVTHKDMTRFNISIIEAVNMVLWAMINNFGGEIFIPKIPSYRILDLVKAFNPKAKIKFIGLRPGEKIYEELISKADSLNTFNLKKYYSIVEINHNKTLLTYKKNKIKKVHSNFEFNSSNNNKFLNENQLRKLINEYKNKSLK